MWGPPPPQVWTGPPWILPRSSFIAPVAPPTAGPCDPPFACIRINAQYCKFIAGAMFQLLQRTSWLAISEDDLQNTLAWMTWAMELVGTAVQCSQPPAIPGQPTDQRACNIAGYLAHYIIRQSMAQCIQGVQNDMIAVDVMWIVLRLIPGFGQAFSITTAALPFLFNAVQSGTIAHFQAAETDDVLWGTITCAIFNAIRTDGQVTDGNFPTLRANVNAVVFAASDVHDAVVGFIDQLGPGGLESLQVPGAMTDYDCSGCATGPALGPVGPAPVRLSGKDLLQIAIGASDAALPILFPQPFPTPPLLTTGSDNEDVIASFESTTTTGTTLRITSAVPASATMSANLDWTATLPGEAP